MTEFGLTATAGNGRSSDAVTVREGGTAPVFIVGVYKRCGTNFLSDLLCLHPCFEMPRLVREDALLESAALLKDYSEHLTRRWLKWLKRGGESPENVQRELFQCLGAGLLSFLEGRIQQGRRLLCKNPFARNVDRFFTLFPQAQLVLLVRDGRDVVESALRSWPNRSRREYIREWAAGAREILNFVHGPGRELAGRWTLVKYEDIYQDRHAVERLLCFLGIAPETFPWERVPTLPVRGSSVHRGDHEDLHWNAVSKTEDFQPIGRWSTWGILRRRQFKRLAGRELAELGYVNGDDW